MKHDETAVQQDAGLQSQPQNIVTLPLQLDVPSSLLRADDCVHIASGRGTHVVRLTLQAELHVTHLQLGSIAACLFQLSIQLPLQLLSRRRQALQ